MKARYFSLLAFVMVMVGSNYSFAYIIERPPAPMKQQLHEPHKVVELYLKAVSRGELIVFERKLDRSMLIPVRVEYVYELNSAMPTVKVYSELKEPMSVPVLENSRIRGVSAIVDADGHIIETGAHILPE